jgi:hypothetical protein
VCLIDCVERVPLGDQLIEAELPGKIEFNQTGKVIKRAARAVP